MKPSGHGTQGEAFLVGFHDTLEETVQQYNASVTWELHTTRRRGVLCFHGTGYVVPPGAAGPVKAGYIEAEYPNSNAGSLEAFLYGLGFRLSNMIAVWCEAEKVRMHSR